MNLCTRRRTSPVFLPLSLSARRVWTRFIACRWRWRRVARTLRAGSLPRKTDGYSPTRGGKSGGASLQTTPERQKTCPEKRETCPEKSGNISTASDGGKHCFYRDGGERGVGRDGGWGIGCGVWGGAGCGVWGVGGVGCGWGRNARCFLPYSIPHPLHPNLFVFFPSPPALGYLISPLDGRC